MAAVADGSWWAETFRGDPGWHTATGWVFLPLIFLAVYSVALALAYWIDRRTLGCPSLRHPAAGRLFWYEVRDLDAAAARELDRRYGPGRRPPAKTPWADPAHDVAGDLRGVMRYARDHPDWPIGLPPADDG